MYSRNRWKKISLVYDIIWFSSSLSTFFFCFEWICHLCDFYGFFFVCLYDTNRMLCSVLGLMKQLLINERFKVKWSLCAKITVNFRFCLLFSGFGVSFNFSHLVFDNRRAAFIFHIHTGDYFGECSRIFQTENLYDLWFSSRWTLNHHLMHSRRHGNGFQSVAIFNLKIKKWPNKYLILITLIDC